jgi:hypothetical protein
MSLEFSIYFHVIFNLSGGLMVVMERKGWFEDNLRENGKSRENRASMERFLSSAVTNNII